MNPATLLVVEDNPTNLKLVTNLLEFEGYRVLQAVDAEAALAVLAHTRPDLVLMDIALPGMDGLALTRKLKAAEKTRDICIVALSAFAMKGDEEKALAAGCAGYITKPIDTRKLLGQVVGFLAPRAASTFKAAGKILVVDDNETDRKLLCAILQAEGLETLQAADGEQALAVLEGQAIGAVISDILMPKMDGFNLCRTVRKSGRGRELPFIFYTASFTSAADEALALQAGADRFLHKPAPAKAILNTLRDATRQTANPRPDSVESVSESVVMKYYSEQLVTKLEEKNKALNQRTFEMEREIVERTLAEREAKDNLKLADGLRHSLLGVIEDQKKAETALRVSEARFRAAALAVSDVIWTNNPQGMMEGEQPGWSQFTGQTLEEYQGYGWTQAVHPEDTQPTLTAWKAALTEKRLFAFEHRVRRNDGAWRTCAIRAVPVIGADGAIREWVGVHTDITELKEAEEKKRQLESQLVQSQKLETLGTLAGGMAHDFNNLLTGVLGFVDLTLQSLPPEHEHAAFLRHAREGGIRASELVKRLLLYARKAPSAARQAVHLDKLIAETTTLFAATLPASIAIRTETIATVGPVSADAGQLQQVLMNLFVNAAQAIGSHPGRITIELSPADGRPTNGENCAPSPHACVAVTDTGCGMDEATQARMFDPFFTTKALGEGTGLGLSIVHGIVHDHGGRLRVRSSPGQGSRFEIFLPVDPDTQPDVVSATVALAAPAGAGLRVLLADDEPQVRMLVGEVLKRAGFSVEFCDEGLTASRRFAEAPQTYALAITDLSMPGRTGFELITEMHALRPDLRVILMSGDYDRYGVMAAPVSRNVIRLPKPFSVEELFAALRRALRD